MFYVIVDEQTAFARIVLRTEYREAADKHAAGLPLARVLIDVEAYDEAILSLQDANEALYG